MAKKRPVVRLNDDDWESLFPGQSYRVGSTQLMLEPMSVGDLAALVDRISSISSKFAALEVTVNDLSNRDSKSESVVGLVSLILKEAPEILADLSTLHVEDVKGLPIDTALDLFNACVDVNLKSKDSLVKNFRSLGAKMTDLTGMKKAE